MSIINVAPEVVLTAAGDLENIGSVIEAAGAAAALPTTTVVPPAADEVSTQLASLFAGQARSYQAVSARAAAFHQEFVSAFTASGTSYAIAEARNASPLQTIGHVLASGGRGMLGHQAGLGHHQLAGTSSKLLTPGSGSIRSLPRASGLKSSLPHRLGSQLDEVRFPFLRQIFQNQIAYWKQFIGALETLNPTKIWDAIKTIAGNFGHNVQIVFKELFDFTANLTGDMLHLGAPFKLLIDALGAPILGFVQFSESLHTIVGDLASGHIFQAMAALVKMPYDVIDSFLFGSFTTDGPILQSLGIGADLEFTIGGLLTGLNPIYEILPDGSKVLLQGAQVGGLLGGIREEGQQLAKLLEMRPASLGAAQFIAPPAPAASPGLVRPLGAGAVSGSVPLGLAQELPPVA